jgi:hypothetical protein
MENGVHRRYSCQAQHESIRSLLSTLGLSRIDFPEIEYDTAAVRDCALLDAVIEMDEILVESPNSLSPNSFRPFRIPFRSGHCVSPLTEQHHQGAPTETMIRSTSLVLHMP